MHALSFVAWIPIRFLSTMVAAEFRWLTAANKYCSKNVFLWGVEWANIVSAVLRSFKNNYRPCRICFSVPVPSRFSNLTGRVFRTHFSRQLSVLLGIFTTKFIQLSWITITNATVGARDVAVFLESSDTGSD